MTRIFTLLTPQRREKLQEELNYINNRQQPSGFNQEEHWVLMKRAEEIVEMLKQP